MLRASQILPEFADRRRPSTVIPILIAAFAAYALAWDALSRSRRSCSPWSSGLLVVPLQMSLIPLLQLYNGVGAFFGGPQDLYGHLARPYRLRACARHLSPAATTMGRPAAEDHGIGASRRRQRFRYLRHDHSCPVRFRALASFAIFQFLWTGTTFSSPSSSSEAGTTSWC